MHDTLVVGRSVLIVSVGARIGETVSVDDEVWVWTISRIESVADLVEFLLVDHPTCGYGDLEVESMPYADSQMPQ